MKPNITLTLLLISSLLITMLSFTTTSQFGEVRFPNEEEKKLLYDQITLNKYNFKDEISLYNIFIKLQFNRLYYTYHIEACDLYFRITFEVNSLNKVSNFNVKLLNEVEEDILVNKS